MLNQSSGIAQKLTQRIVNKQNGGCFLFGASLKCHNRSLIEQIAACFLCDGQAGKATVLCAAANQQVISCFFPPRTNYSLTSFILLYVLFCISFISTTKKIKSIQNLKPPQKDQRNKGKFRNQKKRVKYIFLSDTIFVHLLLNLIITPVFLEHQKANVLYRILSILNSNHYKNQLTQKVIIELNNVKITFNRAL